MSTPQYLYIIKNISPWMMTELICFSRYSKFKVLFIRKVPDFYKNDLDILRSKGIIITENIFKNKIIIKDIIFIINFIMLNLRSFVGVKNFVWGLKSIYWFLKIDKNLLKPIKSIHSQFASQSSILAYMFHCFFEPKIPYYFTFHAHDIFFNNRWFSPLVNNSTGAFSISEYNIKYIGKKFKKVNKERLFISRLGVNRIYKTIRKKTASQFFNIGFLSMFVKKKGIIFLLESFREIVNKDKTILLHIAGQGPLYPSILKFIEKYKLNNNIKLYGKVEGTRKDDFFNNIDLFVLPSITLKNDMDGIPVVLMEAISYGIPIISTNISGIPEICINEYNGILVTQRNSEELRNAIINLIYREKLRRRYSSNSLKLAKKEYDIRKNNLQKLQIMDWIK